MILDDLEEWQHHVAGVLPPVEPHRVRVSAGGYVLHQGPEARTILRVDDPHAAREDDGSAWVSWCGDPIGDFTRALSNTPAPSVRPPDVVPSSLVPLEVTPVDGLAEVMERLHERFTRVYAMPLGVLLDIGDDD